MCCSKKKKDHFSRLLRQFANDKGDNEMLPGTVHRYPRIYHTAEENPGKNSAMRPSMNAVRPAIASNGFPYLQMTSIGSHRTSGMEKEGKKERKYLLAMFIKNFTINGATSLISEGVKV